MRADGGSTYGEVRQEEIDYPVAVGADCGACAVTVLKVGSCLSDLSGRPRISTVTGDGDHDRLGVRVSSRTAAESRIAGIYIPKKRARSGVVRPDLLFVRK